MHFKSVLQQLVIVLAVCMAIIAFSEGTGDRTWGQFCSNEDQCRHTLICEPNIFGPSVCLCPDKIAPIDYPDMTCLTRPGLPCDSPNYGKCVEKAACVVQSSKNGSFCECQEGTEPTTRSCKPKPGNQTQKVPSENNRLAEKIGFGIIVAWIIAILFTLGCICYSCGKKVPINKPAVKNPILYYAGFLVVKPVAVVLVPMETMV